MEEEMNKIELNIKGFITSKYLRYDTSYKAVKSHLRSSKLGSEFRVSISLRGASEQEKLHTKNDKDVLKFIRGFKDKGIIQLNLK